MHTPPFMAIVFLITEPNGTVDESALTARKVGEAVSSTFNVFASAFEYPIGESTTAVIK